MNAYEWAPNAERILYYQDRGSGLHVYSHHVESDVEIDLTPSATGRVRIAAVSVTHPDEVAVIDNSRDPQWYDAWRINVISGVRTRVFENAGSFQDFVFDHSLTPRIGLHYNDDASVAAFRLNGGEVDDLLLTIPTSATRTTDFLGFDSTNQYIYLLGHHGSDKSSLTRVGLDHGEETTIAQGGMVCHSWVVSPGHSAATRTAMGARSSRCR